LAAGGQITEREFEDCRSAYLEFIDLLHNKLPLADPAVAGPAKVPGFFSENSSYQGRFLARARKEGLTFSESSHRAKPKFRSRQCSGKRRIRCRVELAERVCCEP